jgi:uncharacterized membrane protein
MSTNNHAAIGPVDLAVILFEGNQFNGEVAPAIADLEASGAVRILDIAFITKDADGNVGVLELEDELVVEVLSELAGRRVDLLNDEDLLLIGEDLDPNSSALAVVWENTWAAPFAKAVADSGGTMIAYDRIPAEVLQNAFAALEGE